MTFGHARDAMASPLARVVVEAAAGCGKTHEAVAFAIEHAQSLEPGREVLLLAHTRAAVGVFVKRTRAARARVRAMTFDAFAVELAAPYAATLGLSVPLRVGGATGTAFSVVTDAVARLLRDAPTIARAVAMHYPVVICDEHQDARSAQHEIAERLALAGARVRFLGDPMQAIYGFDEQSIRWSDLEAAADHCATLLDPRRWEENVELGRWILDARAALSTGKRIALAGVPPSVDIMLLDALDDVHPRANRAPSAAQSAISRVLAREGSIAVLVRNNAHAVGVHRALSRRLPIHEGSDVGDATELLERAIAADGEPAALAGLIVDVLAAVATGCNAAFRKQMRQALGPAGIHMGSKVRFKPFLTALGALYEEPTIPQWCRTLSTVMETPPDGVKIDLPGAMRTLASIDQRPDEHPLDALSREVSRRRLVGRVPKRCISTIHKAKGEEFDHVVVLHCSASPFPDDEGARRLMYVALSRARRSLTLVGSRRAPTPLFE